MAPSINGPFFFVFWVDTVVDQTCSQILNTSIPRRAAEVIIHPQAPRDNTNSAASVLAHLIRCPYTNPSLANGLQFVVSRFDLQCEPANLHRVVRIDIPVDGRRSQPVG